MPRIGRVVTCELDGYHEKILARAKKHGYQTKSEAVRAGLRLLEKELPPDAEETLSQSAHGDQLKESRQKDHLCPRGIPCEETGIEA